VAAVSLAYSPAPAVGGRIVGQILECLLVYSLVLTGARTARQWKGIVVSFWAAVLLALAAAAYQYLALPLGLPAQFPLVERLSVSAQNRDILTFVWIEGRLSSLFGESNVYGLFMAMSVGGLLIGTLLFATPRRPGVSLTLLSSLFLAVPLFVLSGSRSALLSLIAGCLAAFVLLDRRRLVDAMAYRWTPSLVVVLGLCSLIVFSDRVPTLVDAIRLRMEEDFALIESNQPGSLSAHLDFKILALDVAFRDPMTLALGVGAGGFGLVAYEADGFTGAHDVFLDALSETGIVGLIAVVWLIGAVANSVRRLQVQARRRDFESSRKCEQWLQWATWAATIAFGAFLLQTVTYGRLLYPFIWTTFALTEAAVSIFRPEGGESP
jgi:hypothetical protein